MDGRFWREACRCAVRAGRAEAGAAPTIAKARRAKSVFMDILSFRDDQPDVYQTFEPITSR
jgi:hypothetical protein